MQSSFRPPGERTPLRGRTRECGVLDGLLDSIRAGESRALVVRGDAGIGKTALLEYLIETASDLTVLRAGGVESEMELAYSNLHLLCGPMLARLERLPRPQREALETVFGLSVGPPPDRFLVGLGVLSFLSEAAEERPLLCVIDDAQWLDQASGLILAFVARRLVAERVGIVFAAREPTGELSGFSDLEVHGLRNGDARALLGSAMPTMSDERVRDRIIAEADGNPLALLELPRGVTASQLAGGFGLLGVSGVVGRLEQTFVRQLDALSNDGRRLLLLASAEPLGDPLLLWRAGERLGIAQATAGAAETIGLLAISERVVFRHPLVRSMVYRSAPLQERQAVHMALAEATDRETDPDRRAWHLAAAAAGPDERVASELERCAVRAQARGGVAASAAFLHRAVALTEDPGRRADRALAAAQANVQAGAFDAALRLLSVAEAGPPAELRSARVDVLRGQVAFASGLAGDAAPLLLNAARRLEPLDVALARQTYLDAFVASIFTGSFAGAGLLQEICRAASAAPMPPEPRRPSDLLLDGLAVAVTDGRDAAVPMLTRAARAFAEEEIGMEEVLRWGWVAPMAPIMLWDVQSWHLIDARQLEWVREAGLLLHLPIYLSSLGTNALWRGDLVTAASLIAEADLVANATGAPVARYAAVQFAAVRGSEADAVSLIETVMGEARAYKLGVGVQWCQWASAVLYNGLGEYEKALRNAEQAAEQAPALYVSVWAVTELIEAATRTGEIGVAVEALKRLVEATSVSDSDSDWALGIQTRSRALVSEGAAAEPLYREAIDRLGRTGLRPEVARAHLLYGEWLRRERRRVDARVQLRAAHDQFTTIGMDAFAQRTRRELLATGDKVRRRNLETRDDLTAQERQIAHFARDGLSNPEIGARLFLSPRTVEWHLRKVFSKLGIRSRRELTAALPAKSELVPT
jgi:DNA-binding CsgD family transcriptional regulator/tetratricopeptide (TPR) repeat protein